MMLHCWIRSIPEKKCNENDQSSAAQRLKQSCEDRLED